MKWTQMLSVSKLVCLLLGIVFLTSGLLINLIQFTLYIFLRPISKPSYQKINGYLTYSLFSQLVFLEQYWANIKVLLHVEKYDYENKYGKEHAFLIMNHTYEIDWLIGWILCDHSNLLGVSFPFELLNKIGLISDVLLENCKIFGKKSLKNLPTLGFAWNLGGSIFLERNWEKDKDIFESKLKELTTYTEPIWLFLAAEGTRFTKEKHEASKLFSKEHGLPELRHHLTPRTKGFTTTVPLVRHKMSAVYNIIVGIKPGQYEPSLTNILQGNPITAEFYVERIPIEELPEGKAELSAWLHNLYKKKDDLLHRFLTTGSWFESPSSKKHETHVLKRNIRCAINLACWAFVILTPLFYFVITALISGSLAYCGSVFGIIGSFVFLQEKLVAESKITRASAYGISKDGTKSYKLENRT